jgi:hypothetical protein
MVTDHTSMSMGYEAPALTLLGSVHGLTLDPIDKHLGQTDGYLFMGQGITNASS